MRYVQGESREQQYLFPLCLEDYVGEDNPCRVIDAFVNNLDLKELGFKYANPAGTGRLAYDPGCMLKLYLYGYLNQIRSSRRLEKETYRNVEVMWLTQRLTPDDKTICNFRKDNAKNLKEVFRKFNKLCIAMGLFGQETVSIDGSKVKADNGRKHCYTSESAKEIIGRLDRKIEEYLKALADSDEQAHSEATLNPLEIAKTLKKLNNRKAEMEQILERIAANGGEAACTVDEDARLMKQGNGHGFDVCYNVQTAVDEKNGLIAAFEVTNRCNDLQELSGMAIEAKQELEAEHLNVLADKGYSNGEEIDNCANAGIDSFIPSPKPSHQPQDAAFHRENFRYDSQRDVVICPFGNEMPYVRTRKRDGNKVYANRAACRNCPYKEQCTKSKTLREFERSPYQDRTDTANEMAKEHPELYHRRQELSEHPFGTVKSVWGYGQFLCRGKEKVTAEIALAFLAFNLRRAINIMGTKVILEALKSLRFFISICKWSYCNTGSEILFLYILP